MFILFEKNPRSAWKKGREKECMKWEKGISWISASIYRIVLLLENLGKNGNVKT